MWAWISVAIGGALGSMARHGVNRVVFHAWPDWQVPAATMFVNITGSIMYGLLAGLLTGGAFPMTGPWRELIFVGILGGYTTFSTFSFDTMTLLRAGHTAQALITVGAQLIVGVAGLYAGFVIAERVSQRW